MFPSLGVGAGFLIILATFALAFFREKKASITHVAFIAIGAALAAVSNLNLSASSTGVDVTLTQQVVQQSQDSQAAITQLSEQIAALQQQNQQTVAALKALASAQQQTGAPTAAPTILQGIEASQTANAQRQVVITQSLKRLQLSTANLAAIARVAPQK